MVLYALEPALNLRREPLLVVVLGPTASGKTSLAVAIARRFDGEVVNCDSVAMYREFDIGTAKPDAAERKAIPHHMLDCVDPSATVTAGEYARQARSLLPEIVARRRLPVVSGGTGLYLRALVDGLFAGPFASDSLRKRLREKAAKHGPERLHRILRRVDPASAKRIHSNDLPKLIRALEVCLATRRPMSELWEEGREPLRGFRILRLGLNPDRTALYSRIDERAKQMFARGLIDETARLWEVYGENARPLSSLGYRQALQVVRGEKSEAEGLAAAQQAHRNYAKRQMTWFRREPDVLWLDGFGDEAAIQGRATSLIQETDTSI